MKKKVMLSVLLVVAMITGCTSPSDDQYNLTLRKTQIRLNEEREADLSADYLYSAETIGVVAPNDPADFTQEEVDSLVAKKSYKKQITLEEAKSDTDTLFRLLKTSYGGYGYFGGDETFNAAHDRINIRLEEAYGDGKAMTALMSTIITEELKFVEDSHLIIGGSNTQFVEKYLYYDDQKRDFLQDKDGYYLIVDKKKYYLAQSDDTYLKLTVNDAGEQVYGLFTLAEEDYSEALKLTLTAKNGKTNEIDVTWVPAEPGFPENSGKMYTCCEKDGVSISTLSYMSLLPSHISMTNEFINDATKMREQPYSILDLRSNSGGFIDVNYLYLLNATGTMVEPKIRMIKRNSLLNQYHQAEMLRILGNGGTHPDLSKLDIYRDNKELIENWYEKTYRVNETATGETTVDDKEVQWVPSSNTLIVLIDKDTFSAGEYILYQLSSIENVVIMGTNSNGCMVTGDVNSSSPVYLPNSGVQIIYGQALAVTDRIDDFDTNGWQPDIYTRGNALDSAIKLVKAEPQTTD